VKLPPEIVERLRAKVFAHLAIVDEEGRPHVSPVWVDVEDGLVLINTAEGRTKARLLQEGADVALSATDPDDAYRYVAVRGRVLRRWHDEEGIHRLSRKYRGRDYKIPDGQQRVTVLIESSWTEVYGR
jgi:PPOX class probable F420-dependent enzyme